MKQLLRTFAAALAATLLSGAAAGAQTTAIPIKIATSPAASTAEVYIADAVGYFKKNGLDAQIITLSKGMGSAVTAVVLGKAADIGEGDIVALCAADQHGIPLSILAPSNAYFPSSPPINVLTVAKNSPVSAAKDLNGKVVGAPSLEGPAKVSAAMWLDQHGADLSTVKFVEMSVASMPGALANGTIAAAMVSEPTLTAAGSDLRVLATTYQEDYGKNFQLSYWFATPEWVKANPDAARRFALAMHDTALWVNDPKNGERYAQILQKVAHFSDTVAKTMKRATYGEIVDVALAQPLIDAGIRYKSLHGPCDAKKMVSSAALVAK